MLRNVVLGIAAGLLALVSLHTSEAAGGVYLTESGAGYPSNYTVSVQKWVNEDSQMRWNAVPSSYKSQFQTAINDWEQVLPKTQWTYSTSGDRVKIEVYTSGDRCNFFAVACTALKWQNDGARLGYYIKGADVWINDQHYNFTINGFRATVSHEVGHVHGLADRYDGSGECRSDESTIMDLLVPDPDSGYIISGCNGYLWPTATDISRVREFYALAGARNIRKGGGGPNWVEWKWEDDNWAESSYYINNYYWNGQEWQYVNGWEHKANVATGDGDDARTLSANFTVPAGWPDGYYSMCTHTFSRLYGYQEWRCGPNVYLYH